MLYCNLVALKIEPLDVWSAALKDAERRQVQVTSLCPMQVGPLPQLLQQGVLPPLRLLPVVVLLQLLQRGVPLLLRLLVVVVLLQLLQQGVPLLLRLLVVVVLLQLLQQGALLPLQLLPVVPQVMNARYMHVHHHSRYVCHMACQHTLPFICGRLLQLFERKAHTLSNLETASSASKRAGIASNRVSEPKFVYTVYAHRCFVSERVVSSLEIYLESVCPARSRTSRPLKFPK